MVLEASSVLGTFMVIFVIGINAATVENDGCYYCGMNKLEFRAKCENPTYIPITDELKKLFLNGHNAKRNLVARGMLDGALQDKTATRMATLIWDNELEMISLGNALWCTFNSGFFCSSKRYTKKGKLEFRKDYRSIELEVNEAIELWFKDHVDIDESEWTKSINFGSKGFPPYKLSKQMIIGETTAVGCAIVKYLSEKTHKIHIICTYSAAPLKTPVYEYGPTGSKCRTGMNPKYLGLCSENEFKTNINEAPAVVTGWIKNGKKLGTNVCSLLAPPVTEWIKNGKELGNNILSNHATNESVNWFIKIILPLNLIAAKLTQLFEL